MILLLSTVLAAHADDVVAYNPTPEPEPEYPTRDSGSSGSSGSSKGSSSGSSKDSSSKESDDGQIFKTGKIGKWKYQPYVEPGGGVQVNTSNTGTATSIVAGVDAGIKYWRKAWTGDLYAGGSYTTGDGLTGYEAHLGDQMGRREKNWGLVGGFEGMYSAYDYADGTEALAGSAGVGVPVDLSLGPKEFYGYVGGQPSYFFSGGRGLEVEWHVGVAAKLSWLTGSLGFSQYRSSQGVQNTPTLTVGVGQ